MIKEVHKSAKSLSHTKLSVCKTHGNLNIYITIKHIKKQAPYIEGYIYRSISIHTIKL